MAENLSRPDAWQPFTFGGVARFARAGWGRLIAVASVLALICGGSIAFFLANSWVPVVTESIHHLPAQAAIRDGYLDWPGAVPGKLGGNSFLAVLVNPAGELVPIESTDLQLELHATKWVVRSLLGYTPIPYPRNWIISLSKGEVEPLWGAWKPAILAGVAVAAGAGVMLGWLVLALILLPVPLLIGLYSDRAVTASGAWKLACASLFPGALVMCFGIVLYGLREISPLLLAVIATVHLLLDLIYLFLAPLCLELAEDAKVSPNPFGAPKPVAGRKNPFV